MVDGGVLLVFFKIGRNLEASGLFNVFMVDDGVLLVFFKIGRNSEASGLFNAFMLKGLGCD